MAAAERRDTVVSGTSLVWPGVWRSEKVFWRVLGSNGGGSGPWSDIRSFRTAPPVPSKPTLGVPADQATQLDNPIAFQWAHDAMATSWHLQVATDAGFADPVVKDSGIGIANPPPRAVPVDSGTVCYWRLRAKNAGGVSEWSDTWKFTMVRKRPAALVLTAPAHGAFNVSLQPTLDWDPAAEADAYAVAVAKDALFDTVVFTQAGLTATQIAVAAPLERGRVYYWRVTATNITGSSLATGLFFTLPFAPGAPQLVIPANDTVDLATMGIQFVWTMPAVDPTHGQAASHRIQIDEDTAFAAPAFDSTLGGLSVFLFDRLLKGKRYYWRVGSRNSGGDGAWSQRFTFTTAPAAPGAPALLSPVNQAQGVPLSPTLLWSSAPGAARYAVTVRQADSLFTLVRQDTVTDTSLAIGPLPLNTMFIWMVVALNSGGITPAASMSTFVTLPPPVGKPVLVRPADGATDVEVEASLGWDSAGNAATYRVQISVQEDFDTVLVDTTQPYFTSFGWNSDLANDTRYFWRVRAENAAGPGAWSDVFDFRTIVSLPGPVALLSPHSGNLITADSVTASWNAGSPKADRYWIEVSLDSTFASKVSDSAVTDTVKVVRYPAASGLYYWRVKAHNAAGWGPFSGNGTFTVDISAVAILPGEFGLTLLDFGSGTELRYSLPEAARVTALVFDVGGRLRAAPVDRMQPAGVHTVAVDLPRGVYYLSFRAGAYQRREKIVIGR